MIAASQNPIQVDPRVYLKFLVHTKVEPDSMTCEEANWIIVAESATEAALLAIHRAVTSSGDIPPEFQSLEVIAAFGLDMTDEEILERTAPRDEGVLTKEAP